MQGGGGWLPEMQTGLAGAQVRALGDGVCAFPQTFIDMEGSGFSGDPESLRVSVPRPGCLHDKGTGGEGGQGGAMGGAVLWWVLCA